MGLFKALGKIAGGVLKTGLSVATRGISDKVINVMKNIGQAKRQLQGARRNAGIMTEQEAALVNKMGQATPRMSRTELMRSAEAGGGQVGAYTFRRKKPTTTRRAGSRLRRGGRRARAASPAPRVAPARSSGGSRAKAKPRKTGRRGPPPGGLDLKAMSAEWKAAGKPGSWQQWIRENQIRT